MTLLALESAEVTQAARSDLSFPDALQALMADSDASFRDLARLTEKHRPGGYSAGYLNQLSQGLKRPTPDAMEIIAQALDTDPRYFLEYRQHLAAERAAELTKEHGLDEVLQALRKLK